MKHCSIATTNDFIAAETRPTQTIRLVYILLVGQIHGLIYIFLTPSDAITTNPATSNTPG